MMRSSAPGSSGASSLSTSSPTKSPAGCSSGSLGSCLEQRVLRQFLRNEGVELEIAELEELDRLAQLGRQDQLLRLADA